MKNLAKAIVIPIAIGTLVLGCTSSSFAQASATATASAILKKGMMRIKLELN